MKKLKNVLERLLLADLIYLSFGCEHDFNIQYSSLMISHNFCNCQKLFFKEAHKRTFNNQKNIGDSSLPHVDSQCFKLGMLNFVIILYI